MRARGTNFLYVAVAAVLSEMDYMLIKRTKNGTEDSFRWKRYGNFTRSWLWQEISIKIKKKKAGSKYQLTIRRSDAANVAPPTNRKP